MTEYPASRVSFDLPLPDFSRKIEGDVARRVVTERFWFIPNFVLLSSSIVSVSGATFSFCRNQ